MTLIRSLIPLFCFLPAAFFGRLLGSENHIMTAPASLFLFFLLLGLLINLTIVYRARLSLSTNSTKRKKIFFISLVGLIYVLVVCLSHLLRFLIFEKIVAFLGVTTTLSYLILNVSSGPHENGNTESQSGSIGSIPLLESESSSESLNTFRNVIMGDNEAELYRRIRFLERQDYYNLPPQNNNGDYERLVREHFDQALNVDHYRFIWDQEYLELQVLEKKAMLQDRLQNLMITEKNIDRIIQLSPYTDVRKEAYNYIQYKVEPVSSLSHAFQRHIMEGSLNSFINQLPEDETQARQSEFYRDFYRYFTDEDFRRSLGLPLP